MTNTYDLWHLGCNAYASPGELPSKPVLGLLRLGTQAWWYNKKLREEGRVHEAQKRERESIRSNVRHLRKAILCTVGRGGWSIHMYMPRITTEVSQTVVLQGYNVALPEYDTQVLACYRMGVPVLDSRFISDDDIFETLNLPLLAHCREEVDPHPWGPLSQVHLEDFVKMRIGLGAKYFHRRDHGRVI